MLRLKGGAPEPIEKGDSDEDFVETNPVRRRKGRKLRKRKVTGELTKDEAGSFIMEISLIHRHPWGTQVMALKVTRGNKRFRLFLLSLLRQAVRRQGRFLRVREEEKKKMVVTKMSEILSLQKI